MKVRNSSDLFASAADPVAKGTVKHSHTPLQSGQKCSHTVPQSWGMSKFIHKKHSFCYMWVIFSVIFLTFGYFASLQKSLRDVQQILNSTEGNFHQLVALLNCRGLNKVTKTLTVKWNIILMPTKITNVLLLYFHTFIFWFSFRTTLTHWKASVTTGWKDCSTFPCTPSSLLWPSPLSSALCLVPGGASPGERLWLCVWLKQGKTGCYYFLVLTLTFNHQIWELLYATECGI